MDCPSEENLIRMKLQGIPEIHHLQFDLQRHSLIISHSGNLTHIIQTLDSLNLGSQFQGTADPIEAEDSSQSMQRRLLWIVLGINFIFFAIEMIAGWIGQSMGLIADSLDMLADSLVYGLSLLAVGTAVYRQKQLAVFAGILQMLLASLGFVEVIRRVIGLEKNPDYVLMVLIAALALIANSYCLYLLQKSKSKEAHMQASMIFTSNDILINVGVILAGLLVFLTSSPLPDLIIGSLVFILVLRGAWRILQLAR